MTFILVMTFIIMPFVVMPFIVMPFIVMPFIVMMTGFILMSMLKRFEGLNTCRIDGKTRYLNIVTASLKTL